jgi:hypothetical protein
MLVQMRLSHAAKVSLATFPELEHHVLPHKSVRGLSMSKTCTGQCSSQLLLKKRLTSLCPHKEAGLGLQVSASRNKNLLDSITDFLTAAIPSVDKRTIHSSLGMSPE